MCHAYRRYDSVLILKEEIEESLMDYNPTHLNTINFDYLHLINEINLEHDITDDFKYIFGSIMSLVAIYYFVVNIISSICKR